MRIKFYFSLFVAFFIITVNYYANFYQVYWIFPWFDIPMHILGGVMVGLFAQTAMDKLDRHKINKKRFMLAVSAALIVGVLWELAEWHYGVTDGLGPVSRLDTIKDIMDDIIGGALSIWVWGFLFNKTKIHDK